MVGVTGRIVLEVEIGSAAGATFCTGFGTIGRETAGVEMVSC